MNTICDKVTYETYKDAANAAKAVTKRCKQGMKVYKCNECKQFHLASVKHTLKPAKDLKYPVYYSTTPKEKPVQVNPKMSKAKQKGIETKGRAFDPMALARVRALIAIGNANNR